MSSGGMKFRSSWKPLEFSFRNGIQIFSYLNKDDNFYEREAQLSSTKTSPVKLYLNILIIMFESVRLMFDEKILLYLIFIPYFLMSFSLFWSFSFVNLSHCDIMAYVIEKLRSKNLPMNCRLKELVRSWKIVDNSIEIFQVIPDVL